MESRSKMVIFRPNHQKKRKNTISKAGLRKFHWDLINMKYLISDLKM